jgi:hypothetical protein
MLSFSFLTCWRQVGVRTGNSCADVEAIFVAVAIARCPGELITYLNKTVNRGTGARRGCG